MLMIMTENLTLNLGAGTQYVTYDTINESTHVSHKNIASTIYNFSSIKNRYLEYFIKAITIKEDMTQSQEAFDFHHNLTI